jgi:hypothetical protein
MKIIISIIFITLFSINLISDEIKKTDEELIAEFMQLEKKTKNQKIQIQNQENEIKAQKIQIKEQENEIKALEKLEKTVDELAKTLGVDK